MVGRPSKDAPAKAPQILREALDQFSAHGYQSTTMNAIALSAGMSKQTLYRHFGNKEDLFISVVQDIIERAPITIDLSHAQKLDTADRLASFAMQLAYQFSREEVVGIFRMVISEGRRNSHLGQHFYTTITSVAAKPLAQLLTVADDRGLLSVEDPFESAVQFIALLKEEFLWPRLLGRSVATSDVEKRRIIGRIVARFIAGHSRIASPDDRRQTAEVVDGVGKVAGRKRPAKV